ncbi:hypothetical protein D9V34_11150 [Mycetocola lacteus]|uniref:Uncharacterized protein n=1 Tax=Mycetocola lacteus TaxID=76637 RepID=A0A3L7API0_9MICO|nr:hypothetical protein D9V34_11150 [Mycetocola lacteus]
MGEGYRKESDTPRVGLERLAAVEDGEIDPFFLGLFNTEFHDLLQSLGSGTVCLPCRARYRRAAAEF